MLGTDKKCVSVWVSNSDVSTAIPIECLLFSQISMSIDWASGSTLVLVTLD